MKCSIFLPVFGSTSVGRPSTWRAPSGGDHFRSDEYSCSGWDMQKRRCFATSLVGDTSTSILSRAFHMACKPFRILRILPWHLAICMLRD